MIVTVQYEKGDFDSFHDSVYDLTGQELTHEKLELIWLKIPEHIQNLAIMWGMSDTEVREKAYEYLEENPELLKI